MSAFQAVDLVPKLEHENQRNDGLIETEDAANGMDENFGRVYDKLYF